MRLAATIAVSAAMLLLGSACSDSSGSGPTDTTSADAVDGGGDVPDGGDSGSTDADADTADLSDDVDAAGDLPTDDGADDVDAADAAQEVGADVVDDGGDAGDVGADAVDGGDAADTDTGDEGLCPTDDWPDWATPIDDLGRVEPEDGYQEFWIPFASSVDETQTFTFELGPGCTAVSYVDADEAASVDLLVEGPVNGPLAASGVDYVEWLYTGAAERATTVAVTASNPEVSCEGFWTGFYVTCSFVAAECIQDEQESDDDLPNAEAAVSLEDGDSVAVEGVTGLLPVGDKGYLSDTDVVTIALASGCTVSGGISATDPALVASAGWETATSSSANLGLLPTNATWSLTNTNEDLRYLKLRFGSWTGLNCIDWSVRLSAQCPADPNITCEDELEPNDDAPFVFGPSPYDYPASVVATIDGTDDPVDQYSFLGTEGCSLFVANFLPDTTSGSYSTTGDAFTALTGGDLPYNRVPYTDTGEVILRLEDDTATCEQYVLPVVYSCTWTTEACSQDDNEADDGEGDEPIVVANFSEAFTGSGRVGAVVEGESETLVYDNIDRYYADVPAGCALMGEVTQTGDQSHGRIDRVEVALVGDSISYLRDRGAGPLLVHNRSEATRRYWVAVRPSTTMDQCVAYDISLAVACDVDDTPTEPVRTVDDLRVGELLVSEVLVEGGTACTDASDAPYLELLYLGEGSVNLNGLYFHNTNAAYRSVNNDLVLATGERAVLGLGGITDDCIGVTEDATLFTPLRADDLWTVANGNDVLDVIDLTDGSPLVPWTPDVAWERDDSDPGTWCLAEDPVPAASGVLGTPGTANGTCSGD